MNRTGIPYLDYAWNPCGFGCSKGCETCWAASMAKRFAGNEKFCPDCGAFKVHYHPERLGEPAKVQKPSVIGVQFTGELFDPQRPIEDVLAVLDAAYATPRHTYVFLTQQPARAATIFKQWLRVWGGSSVWPDNWFAGATVRNQAQLTETCGYFGSLPARQWLSLEPLEGPLDLHPWSQVEGVVIGHDNQKDEPGTHTTGHVHRAVTHALEARVLVYVKQLWLNKCNGCHDFSHGPHGCPSNGCFTRKLHHDPREFQEDLQLRELPWTLNKGISNA